jgi:predicted RNA-binding protein
MIAQQTLHDITYPLVQTGIYKDEESALINLVIELIEKKLNDYRMVIQMLEDKYRQNFEQFTQAIQHKATFENEEDWMEWKAAVEMRNAWNAAKQQLLSYETRRN